MRPRRAVSIRANASVKIRPRLAVDGRAPMARRMRDEQDAWSLLWRSRSATPRPRPGAGKSPDADQSPGPAPGAVWEECCRSYRGVASQPQALQVRRSTGCWGRTARAPGRVTAPKHERGNLYPRKGSPQGWYDMAMVLVVDHERRPCAPVHPGRARHLLNPGRAAVFRRSRQGSQGNQRGGGIGYGGPCTRGGPGEQCQGRRLRGSTGGAGVGLRYREDGA